MSRTRESFYPEAWPPGTGFAIAGPSDLLRHSDKGMSVSTVRLVATFLLTTLPLASAFAQSAGTGRSETLEEVVVVGRVPGPPLWKVSRGDHALWILPELDVYPKKMEWNAERVERLIVQSQEYISPPGISSGIATSNPFHLPRVMRLYNTMVKRQDKETLADDLSSDTYQRFSILKARYFPKNRDIETQTVASAANAMRQEVLEHENLAPMRVVSAKLLKGNKTLLRTDTSVRHVHALTAKEIKALTEAMKQVMATPAYANAQAACFEVAVDYFENELGAIKQRANAWATGRVDGLLAPVRLFGELTNCMDPFASIADLPAMQKIARDFPDLAPPDLDAMRRQSRQKWLDAAETALSRSATSFSMLSIDDIVNKTGLVAQLEAKGYTIEIFAQ